MKRCLFLLWLLAAPCAYAADAVPPPIKESDILPYLEQVIAWSRTMADTERLPDNAREAVLKDGIRRNAGTILHDAFTFARAEAVILESAPAAANAPGQETQSRRERLLKAVADADQKAATLQDQLKQASLPDMEREKLKGELKLAQARQSLLQTMLGIVSSEGEDSGALIDQVNALSRTVNASADQPAKETAPDPAASKDKESVQESAGMLKLSGDLLSLSRKKNAMGGILAQTRKLNEATHALIAATRDGLRTALAESNSLAVPGNNPADLSAYRQSVDELVHRYKQLSAAIIPLGEMSVMLTNEEQGLKEWNRLIDEDWSNLLRQLMIRIAILAVSVAVPLILSALSHRAIRHYAGDARRRKQLEIARRIILYIVIAFVVLANFLTEFGSLATFAGFMTAGLAVALQTVLISLVAHFLYFGRYGIRSGDRITVSGVTGEVVHVGMLRLYIRELEEKEGRFMPTEKIVAFPNSILFQPTAFYKHVDNA